MCFLTLTNPLICFALTYQIRKKNKLIVFTMKKKALNCFVCKVISIKCCLKLRKHQTFAKRSKLIQMKSIKTDQYLSISVNHFNIFLNYIIRRIKTINF